MKVVKDYVAVKAELEKRGLWGLFSSMKQHNRTLTRDLEVFYGQFDYPEPRCNFLVWFRYEEQERDVYENLVQHLTEGGNDAAAFGEINKFLADNRLSKQQVDPGVTSPPFDPPASSPAMTGQEALYVLKDKQGRLAAVHIPWIAKKHGVNRIVMFIATKSLARRSRKPGQKIVLLQPAEVRWVINQPKYQDTPTKWFALLVERDGEPYCVVLGQDETTDKPQQEPEHLTKGKHQLPGMFDTFWGSGKSRHWRWN